MTSIPPKPKWSYIIIGLYFASLMASCRVADDRNVFTIKLDQPLINDEDFLRSLSKSWAEGPHPLVPDFDLEHYLDHKLKYQTIFVDGELLNLRKVSLRSADVKIGRSKFRIGLMDANMDGTYNQIGQDYLVLSKYQKDTLFLFSSLRTIVPIEKESSFQIDRDHYEITYFDTEGKEIGFRKLPSVEWGIPITGLTTYLPRFMVEDRTGEKTGLWNLMEKDRALAIINWHDIADERDADIVRKFINLYPYIKQHYSVVGINYWNTKNDFKHFEEWNVIPFKSYHINDKYYCYLMSCSTTRPLISIYDKDQHLLEDGISIDQFEEKISSNK